MATTTGITATTDTSAAAAQMKQSTGMNKDDFLKLFIAQLKYQDPMAPQDPKETLGQLAQLTQVEQSYTTNTNLQALIAAQQSANTASVSLIGKSIMANGNAVQLDGSNATSVAFSLPAATATTTLQIRNEAGSLVGQVDLGAGASGINKITWDGRDSSGNMLPAGVYAFSVAGTTSAGTAVTASTYTTGTVDGINMSSGSPMLTMGNMSVSLSDVVNVKGA